MLDCRRFMGTITSSGQVVVGLTDIFKACPPRPFAFEALQIVGPWDSPHRAVIFMPPCVWPKRNHVIQVAVGLEVGKRAARCSEVAAIAVYSVKPNPRGPHVIAANGTAKHHN